MAVIQYRDKDGQLKDVEIPVGGANPKIDVARISIADEQLVVTTADGRQYFFAPVALLPPPAVAE